MVRHRTIPKSVETYQTNVAAVSGESIRGEVAYLRHDIACDGISPHHFVDCPMFLLVLELGR